MSRKLTDVEVSKLEALAGAMEWRGFKVYRTEAMKTLAAHVDLARVDDDAFTKILDEFRDRPAPRTLGARLADYIKNPFGRPANDQTSSVADPVAPWRQSLAQLPRSYATYLRGAIHQPAFFEELARRCPNACDDSKRLMQQKGFEMFAAQLELLAMSFLWKFEMLDGRMTQELLDALVADERAAARPTRPTRPMEATA